MHKYIKQSAYQEGLTGEYGFDNDGYPTFSKARVSSIYRQDYRYWFNPVTVKYH